MDTNGPTKLLTQGSLRAFHDKKMAPFLTIIRDRFLSPTSEPRRVPLMDAKRERGFPLPRKLPLRVLRHLVEAKNRCVTRPCVQVSSEWGKWKIEDRTKKHIRTALFSWLPDIPDRLLYCSRGSTGHAETAPRRRILSPSNRFYFHATEEICRSSTFQEKHFGGYFSVEQRISTFLGELSCWSGFAIRTGPLGSQCFSLSQIKIQSVKLSIS